jgi:hypothetical protein
MVIRPLHHPLSAGNSRRRGTRYHSGGSRETLPDAAALAMSLLLLPWHASAQIRTPPLEEVGGVVPAQWHAGSEMDSMQRFRHSDQRVGMPAEPVTWAIRAGHERERIPIGVHGHLPIEIGHHNDTFVIHELYYSPIRTDQEGKLRILYRRYTDTLVHERDQWRFPDWNGEAPDAALSGQQRTWERTH